ncbi:ABC transporter permease [Saccharopolyspora rhizosphaerae]|uniref:ABC transporter permease n=1 Tax=Saccharopolyspora rhizosphaerae TaxID=2492662 RepID=A0A3R8P7Y8_9PSEU|nr:ABC transporter permease [Saccharopolyspora rhizosphaerae]RRO18630.1 ABC transporter permease [Saccharopolyspora rhizosphaerae]
MPFSSESAAVPVTPVLAGVITVLLLVTAGVVGLGGVARWWQVLSAGARGALQLLVVSLVIAHIVDSAALVLAFLVLMFGIAARTAGRRITGNRTWWWVGLPIAMGVVPVVVVVVGTGAVPTGGLVLIPLVGQLIGGALTATTLAGRRVLDELHQRHGEVEAALSLGLSDSQARWEIAQPVAGTALVPALDQTRTVGTVTLPGAFVGMLLGGASPVEAGIVQLFVLIGLLAVEAVAILVTLYVVAWGRLTGTAPGRPPSPAVAGAPRAASVRLVLRRRG